MTEYNVDGEQTPWTSIDLYYKGFHVKKSLPMNVKFSKIIKTIEVAIDKGFEPSWNDETNKKKDPIMKATEGTGKKYTCNVCGADAERKIGTSKAGREWSGIFCKENKDHVQWNA